MDEPTEELAPCDGRAHPTCVRYCIVAPTRQARAKILTDNAPEGASALRYDLSNLNSEQFEHIAQALMIGLIGPGTVNFGSGKDGAREATYTGAAPYPSASEMWSGEWVFQAKYHDTASLGARQARATVLAELESELTRLTKKYETPCDNYIFITNVPLSGVHKSGTRDRIDREIKPKFPSLKNIAIIDGNDVGRLLENNREVATANAHLISPGDIIMKLMENERRNEDQKAETLRLYLSESFKRDQHSQLEQAGEISDDRLHLRKVFIDLDCARPTPNDIHKLEATKSAKTALLNVTSEADEQLLESEESRLSGLQFLLEETFHRVVLLGGPGEGKSTLGQFLAQIHRAMLVPSRSEPLDFEPLKTRIPFRVVLKDFAQDLANDIAKADVGNFSALAETSLDAYIALMIARYSNRKFEVEDLHDLIKGNATLLILDGLDEVPDKRLRRTMIDKIESYLHRCTELEADVQVLATSRPNSYDNEFNSSTYLHMRLARLTSQQVDGYVEKWISAKIPDESKAKQLRQTVAECVADPQLSLLMTTPLQMTIMILIISTGGTPPRQKEALFAEYLEIIYKREKSKTKSTLLTEKQLLLGLHAVVGYIIHRRASSSESISSSMSQREYELLVRAYLKHKDPFSPELEINKKMHAIIHEVGDRLVLLVEISTGSWGFELRSIQEFFAAAHLCDTAINTEQRTARFEIIARHQHWRNTCLFFGGRLGRTNPGEAANVVDVCKRLDLNDPQRYLSYGRWLALELAAEQALGTNRSLQRSLIEYGLSVVESIDSADISRAAALLAQLSSEDFRDHVIPLTRERLCVLSEFPARRLMTAVAKSRSRHESIGNLVMEAPLRWADPVKNLRSFGSDIRPHVAAALWREASKTDLIGAAEVASRWIGSERQWLEDFLVAVKLGPEEGTAVFDALKSTSRRLQSFAFTGTQDPFQILIQLHSTSRTAFKFIHNTKGPANHGDRARKGLVPTTFQRVVQCCNLGAIQEMVKILGIEWSPIAEVIGWGKHLHAGRVTTDTLAKFLQQTPEMLEGVFDFTDRNEMLQIGSSISLLAACVRAGVEHSTIIASLTPFLGIDGRTRWLEATRRLDQRLKDDGIDVYSLEAFGPDFLDESDLHRVSVTTESEFGIDGRIYWITRCTSGIFWMTEDVSPRQNHIDTAVVMLESVVQAKQQIPLTLELGITRMTYAISGATNIDFANLASALGKAIEVGDQSDHLRIPFTVLLMHQLSLSHDHTGENHDLDRLFIIFGKITDGLGQRGILDHLADDSSFLEALAFQLVSKRGDILAGYAALAASLISRSPASFEALRATMDGYGTSEIRRTYSRLLALDSEFAFATALMMTSCSRLPYSESEDYVTKRLKTAPMNRVVPAVLANAYAWSLNASKDDVEFWKNVAERTLEHISSEANGLIRVSVRALENFLAAQPPNFTAYEVSLDLPLERVGSSWPD